MRCYIKVNSKGLVSFRIENIDFRLNQIDPRLHKIRNYFTHLMKIVLFPLSEMYLMHMMKKINIYLELNVHCTVVEQYVHLRIPACGRDLSDVIGQRI